MKFTSIQKSFFSSTIAIVVQFISQFFLVPVFLNQIGVESYGLWLTFNAAFAFINLLDFGFGVSVSNECMRLKLVANTRMRLLIMTSNTSLIMLGVLLQSLLVICLLFFAHINVIENSIINLLIGISFYYSLNLVLSIPLGLFRVIDKYHFGLNISSFIKLLESTFVIVLLVYTNSVEKVIQGMIVARGIHVIVVYYNIRKMLAVELFSLNLFKGQRYGLRSYILRPIVRSSAELFGNSVIQIISGNGILLIFDFLFGNKFVVQFSTIRMFLNMLKMAAGVLLASIWANLSQLFFEKRFKELLAFIRQYERIVIMGFTIFVVFCFVWIERVFKFWLSDGTDFNYSLFWWMLPGLGTYIFYSVKHTFIFSVNKLSGFFKNQFYSLFITIGGIIASKLIFNAETVGLFFLIGEIITLRFVFLSTRAVLQRTDKLENA